MITASALRHRFAKALGFSLSIALLISAATRAHAAEPLDLTPNLAAVPSVKWASAKVRWQQWVATRSAVCDRAFDCASVFNPNSNRVALVLHGVGSSPAALKEVITLLGHQGYTVLAPRLRGHFDRNLEDLDDVRAADWVQDSEQAFAIAKDLGREVTLVGYSLGGILASRLALRHADSVDRAILFAPAWRITPLVSLGGVIGTILHISLNDYTHTASSCKLDEAYVPGNAGHQVENLILDTETEFGSSFNAKKPSMSVFARVHVPHVIFTSPNDEAIDGAAVSSICAWNHFYCNEISVAGTGHMGIARKLDHAVVSRGPLKAPTRGQPATKVKTVSDSIVDFLNQKN